jgi:hypothetical protein
MGFKRATFTLTTAYGSATGGGAVVGALETHQEAYDDAGLKLSMPSSSKRVNWLEGYAIDDTAAAGHATGFSIYEGITDDGGTTITEGDQLFYIADSTGNLQVGNYDTEGGATRGSIPYSAIRTTAGVVDEFGASLTTAPVRILVRSPYLSVKLTGGVTGDVWTVYVYYETAGDFRF